MDKRRRNLKRRNRARFRRTLVLIVFISIFSLIIYSMNMFFKIKNIVIIDNFMYEESLIIDYMDIGDDHNLFFFNKDKLGEKIVDKFPYIQDVQIQRKIPDTIEIYVQNARELCSYHYQGTSYLLDFDLSVLKPITIEKSKEYFRIFGLEQEDIDVTNDCTLEPTVRIELLNEIINAFDESSKISGITEINIMKIYDIRVKYGGKYEIYLGDGDDLAHKMKFLDEVLKKLTPSDNGVIDLSNSSEARFRPVAIPNSPYPEIDPLIGDIVPETNYPPTLEIPKVPADITPDGQESFNMVLPEIFVQNSNETFDVPLPNIDAPLEENTDVENNDVEKPQEILPEEDVQADSSVDTQDQVVAESFDVPFVDQREVFGPEIR